MGAYTGLYIYDHDKVVNFIIPVLKSGTSHELGAQILKQFGQNRHYKNISPDFSEFDKIEAYFDSGAAILELDFGSYALFEFTLITEAVSHYTNWYRGFIAPDSIVIEDIPVDNTTQALLEKLSGRTSRITDCDSSLSFLSTDETELLWLGLQEIAFELDDLSNNLNLRQLIADYRFDNLHDQERHWNVLKCFCNMARMATEFKAGLIWSIDNDILYFADEIFHNIYNRPIELR